MTREATIWFLRGQQTEQGNTGHSTGVLIPGGSSPEPWCGGLAGIEPCIDTAWKRLCATSVNCWAGTGGTTRGVLTVTLCCKIINNKINLGAREMAQWLRALTIFPEDLSSISSSHIIAHTHLLSPALGNPMPPFGLQGHPHTCTQTHTYVYIKKNL